MPSEHKEHSENRGCLTKVVCIAAVAVYAPRFYFKNKVDSWRTRREIKQTLRQINFSLPPHPSRDELLRSEANSRQQIDDLFLQRWTSKSLAFQEKFLVMLEEAAKNALEQYLQNGKSIFQTEYEMFTRSAKNLRDHLNNPNKDRPE